ncbi:hypothetical protein H5410_024644 [Solanum commersonii]|uniref:Uncharacterized protein n=1 Tax=Solanum commersonii TaxID=4109 RepID=A0A9J5ZMJ5_SOLCO|nr:hypothetical protein H5410_024644 [Solanum commersonii]
MSQIGIIDLDSRLIGLYLYDGLFKGSKKVRHFKKYVIPLENDPDIEIHDLNNLDSGAYLLIPMSMQLFGVLIIGEEMIAYCDTSVAKDTYQIGEGLPV